MLGVVATLAFAVLCALAGQSALAKWIEQCDPAERVGVAGLVGLAAVGLFTLLLGLLPGGLAFAIYPILAAMIVLAYLTVKRGGLADWRFRAPSSYTLLAAAGLALIGLIALVAVLAPSTIQDWDTIAYHLAVPKLWLESGQVQYVRGIHHSNFPSTMECLFLWGLKWGGQAGAKAFSLAVYGFGCAALFGLARRWYGGNAGWWAALAFAGVPVVAWESGTGYIDVAHGLYAALGAVYAVDAFVRRGADQKHLLLLSGLMLGFAIGTKYTGLQMLIAVALVLGTTGVVTRQWRVGVRAKATVAVVAALVACPWYIKTAAYTGNPVYPFFFSRLGGEDWDAWRAEVYTAEQQSFGAGTSLQTLGQAVLGLAYQPGRYTNPAPAEGQGFPTGALGFAALLGGVAAALSGRLKREERMLLAVVGFGFLMWFLLSQQSRYLTMLAIPLGLLGAGQVGRDWKGTVVAGAVALQLAISVFLLNRLQTRDQLQVVTGKVDGDEYLSRRLPFYDASTAINQLPGEVKLVLYDEVFGFYLDRPYFWGNPGHSMLIPYESLSDGVSYAQALRGLGFTHIYLNATTLDRDTLERINPEGRPLPYTHDDVERLSRDLNTKWRYLIVDALEKHEIEPIASFRAGVLYEIVR